MGSGQCQDPAQDTGISRIYRISDLKLLIERNKRHRTHPPESTSAVPKPTPSVSRTCSRSQKGVCTALLSSHLNVILSCCAEGEKLTEYQANSVPAAVPKQEYNSSCSELEGERIKISVWG